VTAPDSPSETEMNRSQNLIEAAKVELLPLIDILRTGKDAWPGYTFEMSARDGVVIGEFVCPFFTSASDISPSAPRRALESTHLH
jgi:hypothetical protein